MAERPLETFITLILEDADAELAQAHRELYPERIPEQIPLSLTLLYPWIPAESVTEADMERIFLRTRAGKPLFKRGKESRRRWPRVRCPPTKGVEIAALLELPVGTVSSRLSRALANLRNELEANHARGD